MKYILTHTIRVNYTPDTEFFQKYFPALEVIADELHRAETYSILEKIVSFIKSTNGWYQVSKRTTHISRLMNELKETNTEHYQKIFILLKAIEQSLDELRGDESVIQIDLGNDPHGALSDHSIKIFFTTRKTSYTISELKNPHANGEYFTASRACVDLNVSRIRVISAIEELKKLKPAN